MCTNYILYYDTIELYIHMYTDKCSFNTHLPITLYTY